jgi:esterase/lipase superfamily enzyme
MWKGFWLGHPALGWVTRSPILASGVKPLVMGFLTGEEALVQVWGPLDIAIDRPTHYLPASSSPTRIVIFRKAQLIRICVSQSFGREG